MDRRSFLSVSGASLALALAGCASTPDELVPSARASASASATGVTPATPTATPTPTPTPTAPSLARVPVPPGTLTGLPGDGNLLAWTVDDGADSEVVRLYAEFAATTGTRLTFFLNGSQPAWTDHADLLRPLVASGQVQLANHTWSHPALTTCSDAEIVSQLQRDHDFVQQTYGVDMRPFFRPPFGYHDARVDAAAASIGYTSPVLWYGSLSDSGLITPEQVVQFATEWFLPQHIVIGHANYSPVTTVFDQLTALITERGLQTVTLDDVFTT